MGGQGREKGSKNKVPRKPSLEVGSTHGVWTILAYEGSRGRYEGDPRKDQFWTCRCNNCGRIDSRTTTVVKGAWKGCRCGLIVSDASFHRAFRTYKRQAKTRGLSFELSLGDFKEITQKDCYYCGQEPKLNSYSIDSKIRIPMNGIDRRDSSLSYTIENCIPCCGTCNLAKLDYGEQEFLGWIDRVSSYQYGKRIKSISLEPGIEIEEGE